MPLSLSWLSFSALPFSVALKRHLVGMPAAFNGGTAGYPVATSPRQQRCANSHSKTQARTPQTGLLRNVLATKVACSVCSRTNIAASPALYRHGLLSKIALKKVFPSRPDSVAGMIPAKPKIYQTSSWNRIESRYYSLRASIQTELT